MKKRLALFKSMMALLLCLSMLVGTTFAWFTDSVKSGINTIAAGVLDVELYHSNAAVTDQKVNSETKLFMDLQGKPILWEPGVVSYENLRVTNEGDLALAYQLAINTANENYIVEPTGEQYGLSQILKVGVVPGGITATDRAGVVASVADTDWTTMSAFLRSGSLLPEEGKSEETWGVVIYWQPGENDNNWNLNNGKTLSSGEMLQIDLGIKLVATQESYESDSFGTDFDTEAKAAVFPNFVGGSASTTVVPNEQGQTSAEVTMSSGAVAATVPAGVQLAEGATELTLDVSMMGASGANISLGENEDMRSLDVHIGGVAADNTVPMTITLKEVAPKGLNMGNYKLYHVEAAGTKEMTLVAAEDAFTAHNQFKYDPATGDIELYMATFSEVALVADTENAWNGEFDYTWYTNPNARATVTEYNISNADQLAGFGAIVGGMNGQTQDSFSGKTVKLLNNITIGDTISDNGKMFYPIGYYNNTGSYEKKAGKVDGVAVSSGFKTFEGTFDGNGHTIFDFYQNTWEAFGDYNDGYSGTPNHNRDGFGLFGKVYGGTVKNLAVSNFSSDGEFATTGCIAAYADGATFENIAIFNSNPRVYNIGNGGIVGCVGWYASEANLKTTFTNITVDNSNKISALWGSYDVACGGIVGQYYPTSGQTSAGTPKNGGIDLVNCHVSAQMDVYNDVCANYQYYAYRYTGMLIGSIRENETIDGRVYPKMDGITASGCSVHYDSWNDYYYCELVDNTTASYTHDHQMSRLVEVKAISGTTITYLDGTTGTVPTSGRANYVIVDYTKGHGTENATCYHFKNGTVWTHDMAGLQDGMDENGDGKIDLKEDKQHIYLPFRQLFTGYGWGVTSKWLEAFDGVGVTERDSADLVEKFKKNDALSGDFLYRVGNQNAFPIGKLFQEVSGAEAVDSGVYVSVTSLIEGVNMTGTFVSKSNWEDSTLHITGGTGPAKLTIQDYNNCEPFELIVEVVAAENITTAKGTTTGGNFVLLCDVNTTTYVNYWNSTLYGNGFTYSLNGAPTAYNSKQGHGILITKNATLDNLVVVGDIYNSYGAYTNQDYYNSAIDVLGDTTIQNCFISNCAAPVSARANVTITNTTLHGGTVANLLVKSGVAKLTDVTTVNYDDGRSLVGMGIVVHSDATEAARLILNGTLTQYNFISESKVPADTYAKNIYTAMFGDDLNKYHFGKSPNRYVNAGIVSMSAKFGAANIEDNAETGYTGSTVNLNGVEGYVYTQPNTSGSVNNSYNKDNDSHISTVQGPAAPNYSFNFDINAKPEDGNDWCKEEGGTVYISMDEGDTFNWNSSILEVTKNGQTLSYTVSMDGDDYTGKSIPFSTAGSYTVSYKYTDDNNYKLDQEGNIVTYEATYEKFVHISVSVVKAAWKDAEIKVNNIAMSGIYVMSGDYDYSYKMKFLDCITITDYDEAGNASTVDLTKSIQSTSFIDKNNANPGKFDANSGTITITYGDGRVLTVKIGAWSGSGPSTKTCSVKTDDGVYLITDGASNAANTGVTWKITGYTYTGNNGKLVSNDTTITFTWDTNSEGYNSKSSGSCFTPDTLITLADGTQKRVDQLTFGDKILAWDFFTGTYVEKDIALLVNHGEDLYEVATLRFSDGTYLRIIGEHGVFDYDLNRYVYLTADNAQDYVGHRFVQYNADGSYNIVTLSKAFVTEEVTSAYSITSASTSNAFANGMLTVAPPDDFYNWIAMDGKLHYDVAQFNKDVEQYGLYTYDVFADYVTYEQFVAWNGAYLKIPVEKGYFTFDYILELIELYKGWMPNT